jgi:hypothetical protein
MLNPEFKARWLEALRGGKFLQGKGALRRNGLHCCLGVACEIGGRDDISPGSIHPTAGEIESWGLPRAEMHHLANMNDVDGLTFEQIADYIERTF